MPEGQPTQREYMEDLQTLNIGMLYPYATRTPVPPHVKSTYTTIIKKMPYFIL